MPIPRFQPATGPNAQLAAKTLAMEPTKGIPSWLIHPMDPDFIEAYGGHPHGSFEQDPDGVYLDFQRKAGTCLIDQYLAKNVLTMGRRGYENRAQGATTGAKEIVRDGRVIDSAEAAVAHLEEVLFPAMERQIADFPPLDEDDEAVAKLIDGEQAVQDRCGDNILKSPYGGAFCRFPALRYGTYGYVHYLTAFVMYPEVMERDFKLQAGLARLTNARAARAITEGGLPPVIRADHDMADQNGTLVDIRMLDDLWLPHFARAIEPLLHAGVRLIWHCDGNLMQIIPRLLEAGFGGFQGFQYEDGMDYERICKMTDRNGNPLMIWAGVSVTTTLPHGTPQDIRDQMAWLVEHGPPVSACRLPAGAPASCLSSPAPAPARRRR